MITNETKELITNMLKHKISDLLFSNTPLRDKHIKDFYNALIEIEKL